MVEKNLFSHDLAVVAILKNEAPYLKEWLDYHLLAGVDHFYLYDNDSTDNQAEVAAPYVKAGLVDYFPTPGKAMQMAVYNDAVKRFKFHCRYMAFIDLDEFIFPKSNRTISEVVDEILSRDSTAASLGIHWQLFGSNGEETADHSRGVLERFTRRAPSDDELNKFVKTIADPRKINFVQTAHLAYFFEPFRGVDENLNFIPENVVLPIETNKMVVNHYHPKSKEEYIRTKMQRGWPCSNENPYSEEQFKLQDRNEVFDDGILKYRTARAEKFSLETEAAKTQRVTKALTAMLSRFANDELSDLETALVCRAASNYLGLKVHEEASLAAVLKSNMTVADAQLFIRKLPKLLRLPYPTVEELRGVALQILAQLAEKAKWGFDWREYVELDFLKEFVKN